MKLLIVLLVLTTSTAFGQSKAYKDLLNKYYDGFPTISITDAKAKIGSKNVYFLDTRELKEFNVSHIMGAKCVGFDNFVLSSVKHIPKNAEIIVYCSIGARSQTIGKKLKKAGYKNVKNLYGGFFYWANMSYPMVNHKGIPTRRIHGYSKEWSKWIKKGTIVY
jgi:rhodanese-related sulfurtransferase